MIYRYNTWKNSKFYLFETNYTIDSAKEEMDLGNKYHVYEIVYEDDRKLSVIPNLVEDKSLTC